MAQGGNKSKANKNKARAHGGNKHKAKHALKDKDKDCPAHADGLVPSQFSDFRSATFWEGFFASRAGKEFEWYGDWNTLGELIKQCVQRSGNKGEHAKADGADGDGEILRLAKRRVLVPGCGNSELSPCMYDAGLTNITNVDFSVTCIREMLTKHVRSRPGMKWLVMDMTRTAFEDNSFDAVVDKGSLDALMGDGDDSDEGRRCGIAFLREVQRLLDTTPNQPGATLAEANGNGNAHSNGSANGGSPSCVYLVVTLAQGHVVRALLDAFCGPPCAWCPPCAEGGLARSRTPWTLHVHSVAPTSDMADAPWQPFAFVAQVDHAKKKEEDTAAAAPGMRTKASGVAAVEELLLRFEEATEGIGANRSDQVAEVREAMEAWLSDAREGRPGLLGESERRGAAAMLRKRLRETQEGQRVVVDLPRDVLMLQLDEEEASAATPATAAAVAAAAEPVCKAPTRYKAAVLDAAGAAPGATQCAVFLVPQGREHEWLFRTEEGQRELLSGCNTRRLVVVSLERGQDFGTKAQIQEELSPLVVHLAQEACRAQGAAPIQYLTIGDGVGQRTTVHRCTSEMNGDIVIEDVTLVENEAQRTFRRMVFMENSNLIQSEALIVDAPPKTKTKTQGGIDHDHLCCSYHLPISAAGIPLVGCITKRIPDLPKVLLVGLGGGGLPMFLTHQFCADVTVVELDPVVAHLATEFFGFEEGERSRCITGDGIRVIEDAARASDRYNVVIIDASGSSRESISCPPKQFWEAPLLRSVHTILEEHGVLAINVVSRSPSAFDHMAKEVNKTFENLFVVKSADDDDVNKVLIGLKCEGVISLSMAKRNACNLLKRVQKGDAHQQEMLACLDSMAKL